MAIEKKMAHIVKQNRPIEKKLIPKAEALELFAKKGQTLKCELIREKAGEQVQCYTMGELHRLLPGPAPALHEGDQGLQAQARAVPVLLEGQGRQPGDAAHLRVRVLHQGGAGRAPPQAGGGEAPRPPAAGQGAGPLLGRRTRRAPGSSSGTPRAASSASRSRTTGATSTWRAGTTSSTRPHIANIKLWNTSGHTEYYKANMYSPIDIEGVEYQLKPMNCPFHITIYRQHLHSYRELPLPLRGAGHGVPLRAVRRAARPAAGARVHPGRRPHLLPHGPARGGDRPRPRLRDLHPQGVRLRAVRHLPLHEAREGQRHRRAVGDGHRGPAQGPGDRGDTSTRWTRARGRSTAPRSTSRSRTRWTGPGSAPPSRWTSTTPTASSSSTSAKTARRTGR